MQRIATKIVMWPLFLFFPLRRRRRRIGNCIGVFSMCLYVSSYQSIDWAIQIKNNTLLCCCCCNIYTIQMYWVYNCGGTHEYDKKILSVIVETKQFLFRLNDEKSCDNIMLCLRRTEWKKNTIFTVQPKKREKKNTNRKWANRQSQSVSYKIGCDERGRESEHIIA